jgi:hypothetical protein
VPPIASISATVLSAGHVAGFGLEFLVGMQIEIGHRHLDSEIGKPFCVGPVAVSATKDS